MKFIYGFATICFLLTAVTYFIGGRWGWGAAILILGIGLAVLTFIEFKKPPRVEFTASVAASIPDETKVEIVRLKRDGDTVSAVKTLREAVPGLSLPDAKDAVDRFF